MTNKRTKNHRRRQRRERQDQQHREAAIMGLYGKTQSEASWSRRSGEVVTYQAGDPKPDLPPGHSTKRAPQPDPRPIPTGPPVSDEVGLENIKKMARLYRQENWSS